MDNKHLKYYLGVIYFLKVCPICAALPSGDPNLLTADLATHLAVEHGSSRDSADPVVGRHIRRKSPNVNHAKNIFI